MPYADPERRREYHAAYSAEWARVNPERIRAAQQAFDQRRRGTSERIAELSSANKRRRVRMRVAVIQSYGGRCAFCGCDQYEYLTVDHIDGGGNAHRAELPDGLVAFLYKSDYRPDLYRVLCSNCHVAWTIYGVTPDDLCGIDYWREFSALRTRGTSVS